MALKTKSLLQAIVYRVMYIITLYRLVIMSNKAQHLVSTVNDNAGDILRMSIAVFFESNGKR